MKRTPKVRAFTLIEMLVVVAILAILVAMLLPALQQARVQAKMVVCLSNLKQTGIGVTTYAGDFSRYYPYRYSHGNPYTKPTIVKKSQFDDLAITDRYMGREITNCPLSPAPLDPAEVIGDPWVETHYQYFWGHAFGNGDKLRRLGDSFSFGGDTFSVLAADQLSDRLNSTSEASHPTQGLAPVVWNNGTLYLKRYDGLTNTRGPASSNYLMTDGSGRRYNRLGVTPGELTKVPTMGTNTTRYGRLPAD